MPATLPPLSVAERQAALTHVASLQSALGYEAVAVPKQKAGETSAVFEGRLSQEENSIGHDFTEALAKTVGALRDAGASENDIDKMLGVSKEGRYKTPEE